jgi:hypothetical protein
MRVTTVFGCRLAMAFAGNIGGALKQVHINTPSGYKVHQINFPVLEYSEEDACGNPYIQEPSGGLVLHYLAQQGT